MEKSTLNFERLADWIDGRLSEENAAAIKKELESADEATRKNAEWLNTFAKAGKAAVLTSPPPELHTELMRRFEAYKREHRQPGFIQRLAATLTFDSGMQGATAGVRSVGSLSTQRQFVYSSDAADIILNFQPRLYDKNVNIVGHVLPGDISIAEPFSIQLLQDTTEMNLTTVDEIGEFGFEAVPPGVYTIILSAKQTEVLIFPVEINL